MNPALEYCAVAALHPPATSPWQPQMNPMIRNPTASDGTRPLTADSEAAKRKSTLVQQRNSIGTLNSATIGPGRFQATNTLGLGALLVAMIVLAMVLYLLMSRIVVDF